MEFVTGLLFVFFFFKHQEFSLLLVRDWIFVCFLVVIFVYDLRYQLILDRFTIPAMILAILFNLLIGEISATSMLLGAVLIGGFFFGQFALSKGTWVGGGDIRLGVLMGLLLGLTQGLVALFIAYLLGALVGVILLLLKKVQRQTSIAFGTFLSIATALMMFFGGTPLDWYLSLFV